MAAKSRHEDDLWKDYSPSCWSKRFSDRELLVDHHLRFIKAGSDKALTSGSIEHRLNVAYGEKEREKLDIFGTDLPDDAPILVYVHGGYWHLLSREESRFFVEPFHSAGIKTIIVGYELCPDVTLGEIVGQIKKAARYVFDYAVGKTRNVYFMGHSAGAHLIAKLLSDRAFLESTPNADSFRGAFLIAGIYDLMDLIKTPENDYLKLSAEEARRLSPQFDSFFHLRDRDVRLYVIAAQHDSPTFVKQSRNLYDKLMESCQVQRVHFKIADGKDHFHIAEDLSEPDNYLIAALTKDLSTE